ncbi:RIP metalloprotease RseP [Sulfurospirillum arcachonense]|uniref:RIP metalloprotease RseP n=1 Tax=Sulfurospirillum arcachonense TaxID=57666 RepID=UPI0004681869|nr:RIP metalloprotease RseP [Sulfurospirillum arcachonense]
MGIVTSLLVLSFLIFFHELGHFLAARFFGVHVEVFSIGFGKKVFSKIIGKTEYCFSMIPLGGYVQMKGQDDSDPTKISYDEDSYTTKNPWQRVIILFAGPFANFLLAFILYFFIANIGVTKLSPIIGNVSENSPAQKIGLMKKDKVIQINETAVQTWNDLSILIKKSEGPLLLRIQRDRSIKKFRVTPDIKELKNMFGEPTKKRILGISPLGETMVVHYTPLDSLVFAYEETLQATTLILTSLKKLVQGVIPAKDLGGVVSIVQVTAQASEAGIIALFALTALISVNLGVLNLLPIPALDGGHIMFNIYEIITKKRPSEKVLYRLTLAGWVLLLSLMAFTIFNDLYRIAGGY